MGVSFLGSSGQFLLKDLVLLTTCFALLLIAGRRQDLIATRPAA